HDDETVTSGYTILQPRVNVHLDGASKSWFSRIFAGSPGVDPYVTAASDVYQDLFGEGSFTGKGIYDLQAFERALANAFPENAILSHDLIEGCHARVGLVTNIEVYDGYPARYEADARRAHRWVRGDWQLLPWLLPRVPYAAGWKRNPLSWLSRWKVADNLRRSLVAPTLLGALIGGWYARPELALWWAVAAWCVCLFPVVAQALMVVKNWPWKASFVEHLRTVVQDIGKTLAQCLLGVAVLPHKSLSMLDAVTRTLWRMLVSRKHLLEWQTAAAVESQLGQPRWASLMQLWYLPLLAVAVELTIPAPAWLAAAPFLVLWLLAPALILLINQPIPSDRSTINDEQRNWLRAFISDTWSFFEAYGNSGDHWLPVDNVQEEPHERIAHRLSPTNEGLFLVSALVARDFGYIGIECLTTLWEKNLSSLHRLEKFNGHFYNWYDTETLLPLNPRYVSTVDSGNLMACLLTVHAGIEELLDKSWSLERYRTGVLDTISLLLRACRQVNVDDSTELQKYASRILGAGESITQQFERLPLDWENWHASLGHVRQFTSFLVASELAVPTAKHSSQRYSHLVVKARVVHDRLAGMLAEYDQLYAWIPWAIDVQSPTQGAQATGLSRLVNELLNRRSLRQVAELDRSLQTIADTLTDRSTPEPLAVDWRSQLPTGLFEAIHASSLHAQALVARLTAIAQQMESLAMGTDFRFLYNEQRRLFAIGLNVDEGRLDRSHYDMLCSESRLASYLAIAKGDVEAAHWFRLGRHATIAAGKFALLSWGGTMFEYLMPPLFQRQFDGSVLTQSCQAAVARQREYGRQQRVPWGISESAFGALAVNADYHYRSFGVPGLGLKRGLAKDLVISPYSTFMALTIDPAGSVANLQALIAEGGQGEWGFYEALDYTAERLPVNKRRLVVRCYMAHHQGMGLLALANLLDDHSIQRRFNAHPIVRAAELLLQERVPKAMIPFEPHVDEVQGTDSSPSEQQLTSRRLTGVENSSPRTHLLSNGTYSVMLTSAGSGYSRSGALDVSRWRSDTTTDNWGQYIYIRDLTFNHIWSPTYQPTCVSPDQYEVIFAIDKVDFHRQQNDLETLLEVAISPENNTEVRQLKITNHGTETRQLQVTSYAEVSLAKSAADLAHPAFQKLFLETEFIAEEAAILARRRPRDAQQPAHWAVHVLAVPAEGVSRIEHETSRQAFLGRRRSVRNPQAIEQASLSGNTGAVLDPIFSIRCTLEIPAGASVTVAFSTAVAESRQEALALADQYHELRNVQRVFELAWAYAQVELRHQHLSPAQVHLYQKLAAYLLYPHWSLRGGAQLQRESHLGQSGLWRHGISGDTPILLARVTEPEQLGFVRELVMAQRFWRERGFATDLILVNDYPGSYYDALQDQMLGLLQDIYRSPAHPNVYLIRGAQLPADELALMDTVAACGLHGDQGTISQQIDAAQLRSQAYLTHTQHRHLTPLPSKPLPTKSLPNKFSPAKLLSSRSSKVAAGNAPADQDLSALAARSAEVSQAASLAAIASLSSSLEFWNGTGGFADDGREYRIHVQADHLPPMPWSQIVANERLGFLCTESGGGYTWFENSRENKLTTWSNDPVADPPSEVLYVQDDVTGETWLPMSGITAEDRRAGVTCWANYGAGYAKFHKQHAVWDQHVTFNVAPEDPVKFVRLTLTNRSAAARAVTVSYYVELVLGVTREQSHWHLQTEFDQSSRALLCRNPYHPEYAQ
ncbi:MAG: glycosyl transferase family 36, partial [Pirellulaceae bacterium]|nr:glycosyl transferase family 36 [Pirellulaceae bacterium]